MMFIPTFQERIGNRVDRKKASKQLDLLAAKSLLRSPFFWEAFLKTHTCNIDSGLLYLRLACHVFLVFSSKYGNYMELQRPVSNRDHIKLTQQSTFVETSKKKILDSNAKQKKKNTNINAWV